MAHIKSTFVHNFADLMHTNPHKLVLFFFHYALLYLQMQGFNQCSLDPLLGFLILIYEFTVIIFIFQDS